MILVGENPASRVYVGNKIKAWEECGVHSTSHDFPADVPEERLLDVIRALNADDRVHGILMQLPLPPQIDMRRVLEAIANGQTGSDCCRACRHCFNAINKAGGIHGSPIEHLVVDDEFNPEVSRENATEFAADSQCWRS